jgi:hypothetical protein
MAYKRRGKYWYRSRRDGRQVQTQYLGAGDWADAMGELDAIERQELELARDAEREERQRQRDIDAKLDAAAAAVRDLTRAALLASGYHQHKGTWRKRRDGKTRG